MIRAHLLKRDYVGQGRNSGFDTDFDCITHATKQTVVVFFSFLFWQIAYERYFMVQFRISGETDDG